VEGQAEQKQAGQQWEELVRLAAKEVQILAWFVG